MARTKDLASARNYVWRLIAFCQRSEREIRDRLKIKEYEPKIVEEVAAYFKDLGYINDKEFARSWIESRLAKPLGLRVIREELKKKGIEEEIIDSLLKEKKPAGDESAIVEKLAEKYLNTLKRKEGTVQRIKPKLYGYLIRRGFSPDIVTETISRIIKDNNQLL